VIHEEYLDKLAEKTGSTASIRPCCKWGYALTSTGTISLSKYLTKNGEEIGDWNEEGMPQEQRMVMNAIRNTLQRDLQLRKMFYSAYGEETHTN